MKTVAVAAVGVEKRVLGGIDKKGRGGASMHNKNVLASFTECRDTRLN